MIHTQFYQDQTRFLAAVDCIILHFDNERLKVLTFRRKLAPFVGGLSLLGGFIYSNESADQAANRVVKELTGLDNIYMQQVGAYTQVDRDPGERVISIAYFALITLSDTTQEIIDYYGAEWMDVDKVDDLIFDHKEMLDNALDSIRKQGSLQPIAFNLLPERFTLPRLQQLYEAIYNTKLDKRNFRKKVLGMDILDRLDEKDMENSKRGAYYFVFNKEKYDKMIKRGIAFTI